jgi:hypothetical protein
MIKKIAALLIGVAFCAGQLLHAQSRQEGRLSDSDLLKVNPSIRAQIRAIGDSAAAAGLSAKPIIQAVYRGQLKRAEPSLIVQAALAELQRLRVAQSALGSAATSEDIAAGADAIKAGANAVALTRIALERRNSTLFVSLGTLADLLTFEVPVDTAVAVVTGLVASGARDADLSSFKRNVQSDIATGRLPSIAASMRGEAIMQAFSSADFTGVTTRANTAGRSPIPPEEN